MLAHNRNDLAVTEEEKGGEDSELSALSFQFIFHKLSNSIYATVVGCTQGENKPLVVRHYLVIELKGNFPDLDDDLPVDLVCPQVSLDKEQCRQVTAPSVQVLVRKGLVSNHVDVHRLQSAMCEEKEDDQ